MFEFFNEESCKFFKRWNFIMMIWKVKKGNLNKYLKRRDIWMWRIFSRIWKWKKNQKFLMKLILLLSILLELIWWIINNNNDIIICCLKSTLLLFYCCHIVIFKNNLFFANVSKLLSFLKEKFIPKMKVIFKFSVHFQEFCKFLNYFI